MMSVLELISKDPRLEKVRASLRPSSDPSHDLLHLLRVAEWTIRLGAEPERPEASVEAVAAALLHDLVPIEKSSKDRARASELSATESRQVLADAGFDPGAVERIQGAIRTCSFSRGERPTSDLGRALADADALDALGAIGVLRTATTGARMGSRYYDPDDPFASVRPPDDRRQTIDHFYAKLFKLPDRMHSAEARAEAERRVSTMKVFLVALASEIQSS